MSEQAESGWAALILIVWPFTILLKCWCAWKLWHWSAVELGLPVVGYAQIAAAYLLFSLVRGIEVSKSTGREQFINMMALTCTWLAFVGLAWVVR